MSQTSNRRIWDEYVPIVENKNEIYAYITDGIADPSNYNELCHRLYTASESDVFTLHINTPGGIIDSATMIIDAIQASPAHVIAHLTGTVASAGTMIALSCDELRVSQHLSFMIHNYSAGMQGKGNELKVRQKFADESLERAFNTFYLGFLT